MTLIIISDIGSAIFGLDDVTIIHSLSYGLAYGLESTVLPKLSSFSLSIIWWYLIACTIMYIKNRKQSTTLPNQVYR